MLESILYVQNGMDQREKKISSEGLDEENNIKKWKTNDCEKVHNNELSYFVVEQPLMSK